MPEPFVHEGNMLDQYQVFVIHTGVTEAKEVKAVEISLATTRSTTTPWSRTPTCHVIAQAQALDAADPNPGYESFGDYGVDVEQFLFGGGARHAAA